MRSLVVVVLVACGSAQPAPAPAPPPAPAAHAGDGGHAQHKHHGAQPLGHRFEQADRWAKVFDDPARDAWQKPDVVVAALELAPGMTVADVGAGTGYFEARLSAAVGATGKVVAVDVEPDMVRYLRERATREGTANVEARLGTPADAGLAASSFDRILIVNTWHHIPDRVPYTKKLLAALEPGGFVLVVDFTMQASRGPPRSHRIEQSVVMTELEAAGLLPVVVNAGLPDHFVIKAERPR